MPIPGYPEEKVHGHNSPEYQAYFESPQWKNTVKRIKKRDKRCQGCGWIAYLDVHHKTYKHFKSEFDEELVLVCRGCHDAIHRKHKKYNDSFKHSLWKVTDEVLLERKNRPPVLTKAEKRTGSRGGALVFHKTPTAKKPVLNKGKMNIGDNCRHCNTPVVLESSRLSTKRSAKAFHFCKWLRCTKCRAIYLLMEFKVFKGNLCGCKR